MNKQPASDTQSKAFAINLDNTIYGTFAEIGAGQEIAGWFFKVGGAAGTVAKTMSAYDMTVSDKIYGEAKRYVSEARLVSMLDHEFQLLDDRLGKNSEKQLFVVADTVSARNYKGTNECHGWIGVRLRKNNSSETTDIRLHINLLDHTNIAQQEAVGILGVNLLYAAFNYSDDITAFLRSLTENLGSERIEIDVARFNGGSFSTVSQTDIALSLVRCGLSPAAIISDQGMLTQASTILRKRKVLIERGSYRLLHDLKPHVISLASEELDKEPHFSERHKSTAVVNEISIESINIENAHSPTVFEKNLASLISGANEHVMISSFPWYFKLSQYVRRFTKEPIGFVLGTSTMIQLFDRSIYNDSSSQLLEALGKMFSIGAKVYPFGMEKDQFHKHLSGHNQILDQWEIPDSDFISPKDIHPKGADKHLYDFLLESGYIIPLD